MSERPNDAETKANADSAPLVMIEQEDGTVLVLGDSLPSEWGDVLPLPLMDDRLRGELINAVAESFGVSNVAAQLLNAKNVAEGLVRLSPSDVAAIKAGLEPMAQNGWNLGSLTQNGQIVQQIHWLPAGAQGAVAIATAVGPAVAMLAIQFQLAKIQRLVQENIELTYEVLRVVRAQQWAEIRGLREAMMNAVAEARLLGQVSEHVWGNVSGKEAELRKQLNLLRSSVSGHMQELERLHSAKDRQKWLKGHAEAVLSDVQALVMANQAWFVYQALRAGHIAGTADSDPQDARLLTQVVRTAKTEHAEIVAEEARLLDLLRRELGMISVLPGDRWLKIGPRRESPKELVKVTRVMKEQIEVLSAEPMTEGAGDLREPRVVAFHDQEPTRPALRRLQWILDDGETLIAIANADTSRLAARRAIEVGSRFGLPGVVPSVVPLRRYGYVALTDKRLMLMRRNAFEKEGEVARIIDVKEIAGARTDEKRRVAGLKVPSIEVDLENDQISVEFPPWFADSRGFELLESFRIAIEEAVRRATSEAATHG